MLTRSEDVIVNLSGDICVLRLQGSLGPSSARRLEYLMDQIKGSEDMSVLVDASLLSAISPPCMEALTALWAAFRSEGGSIVVYGASGPAADALASIGFAR